MFARNQVHEGMIVRGSNSARYDDVADISGDTIQLSRPRVAFAENQRATSMGDQRGVVWPSYGDEGGAGLLS